MVISSVKNDVTSLMILVPTAQSREFWFRHYLCHDIGQHVFSIAVFRLDDAVLDVVTGVGHHGG